MSKQRLNIICCYLLALIISTSLATPFASEETNTNINAKSKWDQFVPEESARDEISDDLTAADLDLDGAATNEADQEDEDSTAASETDQSWPEDNIDGQDSNIENARIDMSPRDMNTAAGHHHHHGHYVHGWLKMGAETGKKGAFKWHDKHPVGGKGRR